jgi:hypothetical protein
MRLFKSILCIASIVLGGISAIVAPEPCRLVSLSGGGSHGAFEAGVLTKIVESPDWKPWDVHLGVSAGSLGILGLMKDDYLGNSMIVREVWENTKTKDIIQPRLFENSLSGNDKIKALIDNTYSRLRGSPTGGTFVVGVTNLVTGGFESLRVDSADPQLDYIVASTSIPVVFPPSAISPEDVLVDGGLQKNEFFLSSLEYCPPGSIGYHMDLIFANLEVPESRQSSWTLFDIAVRTLDIIRRDFNNIYFKSVMDCGGGLRGLNLTVTLHNPPSAISVGSLDFNQGSYLWDLGYCNSTSSFIRC